MNTPRSGKRDADEFTPPEGQKIKKKVKEDTNIQSNMAATERNIDISDAPEWFKTAFEFQNKQMNSIKEDIDKSLKFASDSAASALSKTGDLEKRITKLELENQQMRHQVGILEDKHKLVLDKLSKLETHSRKNNLVLEGVPEEQNETNEKSQKLVKDIIKDTLEIDEDLDLATVHRFGSENPEGKPRPIVVAFQHPRDRRSVWKKKTKLKNTNYILQENFSKDVIEARKVLFPILKRARLLDDYKDNVYIRMDKLICNGKEYGVEDIDQLPSDLHPEKIFTRSKSGILAFYGKGTALSNFKPCSFMCRGIKFNSTEQCYCYNKALSAGKPKLARRVLLCEHPSEMKRITSKISGFNETEWRKQAKPMMLEALRLKFMSSQRLYKTLMDTGELTLVESNPHDKYWGAGTSMTDEDLFTKPEAKGENQMGKLLMQVRSELRSRTSAS